MPPKQSPIRRVLVAEDDKAYANIYRVKLTNEGFEVDIAVNGEEAIKKAQTNKPDIILLDLIMPEKDGFDVLDVLEVLKTNTALNKIPIIIFSNLGQEEDLERAKKMGASDYLIKANISIHEMVEKVKSYYK